MDQPTLNFYNNNYKELQDKYSSSSPQYMNLFHRIFRENSTILDIGSGSGRDLNTLLNLNFDAYGIEVSNRLIESSTAKYPCIKDRVLEGSLPDNIPKEFLDKKWDSILAAAVLQHIPDSKIFDSIYCMHNLLKENGYLLLSIPTKYPEVINNRDKNNRLFHIRSTEEYLLILERVGFTLIEESITDDALNRDGVQWTTLLLKKKYIDGIRPIDKIESIIREDKKVTTYKFGLLRAMGELGSSPRNLVTWTNDGYVNLNVDLVVDKWIEYYWPIMGDNPFIYQGQKIIGKNDIKFRDSLTLLVEHWQGKSDGYLKFEKTKRQERFSDIEFKLYTNVKKQISYAILQGPVKYMGNSKTGSILSSSNNMIKIPGDLWKEFSLMGRWFEDSIILRWAELSAQYKHQPEAVTKAYIFGKLIEIGDLKRSTNYSKKIFDIIPNKKCVWSGIKLENTYAIDHAIPYSIWKNNASWNLFPTDTKVNGHKSDKLPTKRFLISRRESIYKYWDNMFETEPKLFNKDLSIIAYKLTYSNKTKSEIFSYFQEHMEMLALRNSAERWEL